MIEIEFGALAPKLTEQIKDQTGALSDGQMSDIDTIQKDADAVNRLYVRGVLSEAATRTARKRLMNKIAKVLD